VEAAASEGGRFSLTDAAGSETGQRK